MLTFRCTRNVWNFIVLMCAKVCFALGHCQCILVLCCPVHVLQCIVLIIVSHFCAAEQTSKQNLLTFSYVNTTSVGSNFFSKFLMIFWQITFFWAWYTSVCFQHSVDVVIRRLIYVITVNMSICLTYDENEVWWTRLQPFWPSSMELTTISSSDNNWY